MKRGRGDGTFAESDDMATTALGGHAVASDLSEEARKDRPHSKLWMERMGAFECSENEQISKDMLPKGKVVARRGEEILVEMSFTEVLLQWEQGCCLHRYMCDERRRG